MCMLYHSGFPDRLRNIFLPLCYSYSHILAIVLHNFVLYLNFKVSDLERILAHLDFSLVFATGSNK